MNDIMQLYILFILISVSGCTVFIGLPESNWTTSSKVCSLPGKDIIKNTDIFNRSSNYESYREVEKAWTGIVIKHTRWAAFIGCDKSLSHMDSGIDVETTDDCLRHCSDFTTAKHLVIKDSRCYCLTTNPEINGDKNDCRMQCTNANNTPCSSGQSALVFTFVEGININSTNKYIERECLTTTKSKNLYNIRDCNANNVFGCKKTSYMTLQKSWYEYQEICLKEGNSILYQRETLSKDANAGRHYWTPIFRTHTVVTGKLTKKDGDSCLAVSKGIKNNHLTVENCSNKLPFLCSGIQKKNTIDNSSPNKRFPRFISVPLAVIIACGIFILLLVMIIIYLFFKLKKRREPFLNYSNEMKDGFPRASLPSNKVGLRDTYIDASDAPKRPGAGSYNDVYDDVHKGFIIKE